jgi:signal transduction histidine kinase
MAMKRKIVLVIVLHTLLFLAAGGYLAFKIHSATEDMQRVLRLHDVELLRENFLVLLHAVESDLARGELRQHPGAVTVEDGVVRLESAITACFGCHHSGEASARLTDLRDRTHRFRAMLTEARASGAPAAAALEEGEHLVEQVLLMIELTHRRLEERTLAVSLELARTRYVAYALLLLGPILSGVLGFAKLRSLTRPLDVLSEATRRLQAGDLDHRVGALEDEFGDLAASFDAMAGALQEQLVLVQRTSHLVMVGELAAGLVHEIKNPLAGIKAAVQVIAHEATVSPEDRGVLARVAHEVVNLETLLKSFLEFARPAKPRLDDVDVNALVESTTAFYDRTPPQAAGRPVHIVKDLAEVPVARADPMQLKQILLNLLLNARDAMPGGGAVAVRTRCGEGGAVQIEIADSGRGIRPEHVARIFEPFFTTKPGGTGLGLPVSKRLAEQHGGSLTFEANPAGGTTFRVSLPSATASDAGRAA